MSDTALKQASRLSGTQHAAGDVSQASQSQRRLKRLRAVPDHQYREQTRKEGTP